MGIHAAGEVTLDNAIELARSFFVHTVGKHETITNVHFEEFERADNGDWLITFGYDREIGNPLERLGIKGAITERVYRQVQIDRIAGTPTAIKMRAL